MADGQIEISVYLADVEPVKTIMEICDKIVKDDRVPSEYRYDLAKAVAPFRGTGKTIDL